MVSVLQIVLFGAYRLEHVQLDKCRVAAAWSISLHRPCTPTSCNQGFHPIPNAPPPPLLLDALLRIEYLVLIALV
jgi:hypothetical protein